MKNKELTTKDRAILNEVVLEICHDTQLENRFAEAVSKTDRFKITPDQFHDWIGRVNLP